MITNLHTYDVGAGCLVTFGTDGQFPLTFPENAPVGLWTDDVELRHAAWEFAKHALRFDGLSIDPRMFNEIGLAYIAGWLRAKE